MDLLQHNVDSPDELSASAYALTHVEPSVEPDSAIARLQSVARRCRIAMQAVFLLPTALLLLMPALMDALPGMPWVLPAISISLIAPLVIATRRYRRTVDELTALDDVRLIGPMVDALSAQNQQIGEAAATHLARLLPRLRAADAELLSNAQRRVLDRALGERRHATLAVSIL